MAASPDESDPETIISKDLSQPTSAPSALVPFQQARTCFAIDVSTSTSRAQILPQELYAVEKLCQDLHPQAREEVRVLPWSGTAHPIVGPSYVEEAEVAKFASGIADQGLHGTACVVIMFGIPPYAPSLLNVSVGTAVFAASPNCLFLFHNVFTGDLYILQCKGSFKSLLRAGSENPNVLPNTMWHELPRISYEKLSQIQVPKPIKLTSEQVALSDGDGDGMIIDMNDIYSDRLDPSTVSRILTNDDNLKTVVMSASTRRRQSEFNSWLEKQKHADWYNDTIVRLDPGDATSALVERLINLLDRHHSQAEKEILQATLRNKHKTNWNRFLSSLGNNRESEPVVNTVICSAQDRMDSMNSSKYPYDASILSPFHSTATTRTLLPPRPIPQSDDFRRSTLFRPPPVYRRGACDFGGSARQSSKDHTMCYTPEYHRGLPRKELSGLCQVCGKSSRPMALLLKKRNTDRHTEGFPPPQARANYAYPLATGNVPETDIISTFICCDPCSYFIKKIGRAPYGEQISGAILITNWPQNLDLFLAALDSALEHRFSQGLLLPIFLAILYTTRHRVQSDNRPGLSPIFGRVLEWLIDGVERTISVSFDPELTLQRTIAWNNNASFKTGLRLALEHTCMLQGSILTYPLEGFLMLVLAAENNQCDLVLINKVVYLRFLYCLTRRFYECRVPTQQPLLSAEGIESVPWFAEETAASSNPVSVSFLLGRPLLDAESLSLFERMGESFRASEKLREDYMWAFLKDLEQLAPTCADPVACFRLVEARRGFARDFVKNVG
ncbi:MAG: hypothetical protein M1816_003281 [Peltula sp. TS41687]|nr:MAG: hypothetical protein M1816_003281 [Peltula sp. TS41687]